MRDFFTGERLEGYLNGYLVPFGTRLFLAMLLFVVGRLIAKALQRLALRMMRRAKLEESLVRFLSSLIYALLLMIVIIAALEQLGIKTTAAVAILGAAGLAIGLALQGSLGNFAAGVLIIVFKPYKVGDVILVASVLGKVLEIGVFNTVILTGDNREIIIPNGKVTSDKIENTTSQPTRRIDLVFGIGYDDDIRGAKTILEKIVAEDSRIHKEPAPVIVVGELADSAIQILCRPWVNTPDYWLVRWDLLEKTKLAFDEAGISIPFPQRDVHIHQSESTNDPKSSLSEAA